jgi:hypothetical protein
MVSHMKTTIQISDSLFKEARKVAHGEGITLRALVEEGLRKAVSERHRRAGKAFRLRKVTFKGKGLQPPLSGASWDKILDVSYEGRGG